MSLFAHFPSLLFLPDAHTPLFYRFANTFRHVAYPDVRFAKTKLAREWQIFTEIEPSREKWLSVGLRFTRFDRSTPPRKVSQSQKPPRSNAQQ
jgi:hypothetical protein